MASQIAPHHKHSEKVSASALGIERSLLHSDLTQKPLFQSALREEERK